MAEVKYLDQAGLQQVWDAAKEKFSQVPFVGPTETDAGKQGLVPAPAVADKNKFLTSDGTWAVDDNKQDKEDNTLETESKEVVGAINELREKLVNGVSYTEI